ncbi:uncharacterized protein LAJ45_09966 [Morchella importuna]|uniref:uncharacterized protein n=1 Tax=Morchella importuna TaxID=1174673 RepID=UPI001E8E955C|nr:uncharacterized protein LAJ45_09966 [Morchella importuna]KAH8146044.1 hypothetical protein LAJ45_09966 [Morchella importuna]
MVHRGRGANKFRGGGDASGRGGGGGRGNRGGGGGGRGNRGGGGRGRGGGRGGFFRMAGDENHSFSLADEAKNTERHHGNYSGGSLRHVKISFVAAGHLEPSDLLKPLNVNIPPVEEGQNLMQPRAQRTTSDSTEAEAEDEDFDMQNGESDSPAEPIATGDLQEDLDMEKLDLDPPSQQHFVVDVIGDPSLKPKGKSIFTMPIYSPAREISPERPGSSSSSSSERIVFIPRKMRPGLSRTGTNLSISQEPASSAPKKKKTPTPPPKREPTPPPKEPTPPVVEVKVVETVVSHTTVTTVTDKVPAAPTIDSKPFTRSTKGNRRRKARQRRKDEEEEIICDYIENVAATMRAEDAEERGEAAPAVSMRELGGDDDPEDAWYSATDSEEEAEDSDAVNAYKSIWSEHELEGFDALSTASEGPRGPVKTVIGKRKRPSGVQYLIKWEGYETDDATWVLSETLDSAADAKIAVYEKILLQKATDAANAAASSEDSEGGSDDYDEDDDEDLDEDEKLARFLQHQEEMGITESDLELNLELDELMELSFPGGGGGGGSSKKKGKGKGKSRYADIVLDRRTGRFPNATRFADAYDHFDLMDWERLSLSIKKGKGKKGKGKQIEVLETSDSELEENIRNSWQKDREKKKARKQEREALRAEGLLGRNRTVRDPKAKWKEGMSSGDLRDDITQFLLSELSSISLPPMSKPNRKIVHSIGAAFGLKSKSFGKERSRYTTLYKTSTSARFAQDQDAINDLMAKKRFFGRPDVHSGRGGRGGGGRGRGGAGGVVHHREGDVVGGSAPEIAEDNKGRRMLEKMGYRTGMALGIDGNKGIVVPVAAIVKISKAGLG